MILAIESSCDESALAIFDPNKGMRVERVHSQIALHSQYGGVVPDLASREHLDNFPLLLSDLNLFEYREAIQLIAVTRGPGLAGCLAMGGILAKSLSLNLEKPLCGVNHLRGHAWSPFIPIHKEDPLAFKAALNAYLPHLGLIVSGGNTILFEIAKNMELSIISETVDDAAGEALDKGGKLMGLPYPAGSKIEELALSGSANGMEFPRSMNKKNDLRFSFSGLKTSLRYKLDAMSDLEIKSQMPTICASYQEAVFSQLIFKTQKRLKDENYQSLGLSGGVANNQTLISSMKALASSFSLPLLVADPKHNGDNAGMIAFAAFVDEGTTKMESELDPLKIEPSMTLID